ncbi:MAG: hypothetical protein ACOYJF_07720 [Prevotella sp.]|jgi:hypothetical protein
MKNNKKTDSKKIYSKPLANKIQLYPEYDLLSASSYSIKGTVVENMNKGTSHTDQIGIDNNGVSEIDPSLFAKTNDFFFKYE